MQMLTIGELSRRTGVKVPTVRYYEEIGLLPAPERSAGNQRRYADGDVDRLAFIRHARDLGFPLPAIRDLIELDGHPQKACLDADRIAAEQLASVRLRRARCRLAGRTARAFEKCHITTHTSIHSTEKGAP